MGSFMTWVWLGVIVAAIIIEAITIQLVSIWFAASGLISLALSFIPGFPWWGQLILFVCLTAICIFAFRPIFKKIINKRTRAQSTNLDLIIGTEIRVIKGADFDNLGEGKINGVVWSIKPENSDDIFYEGDIVKVIKVEGNKLICKK